MIDLPTHLAVRYTDFLTVNDIEQSQHRFYLKWLRYYHDFCTEYSFKWSETDSLSAFLIKLRNKNQQPFMLAQAKKAVELLWKMANPQFSNPLKDEVPKDQQQISTSNKVSREFRSDSKLPSIESSKSRLTAQTREKGGVAWEKQSGANWRHVYAELESSIKMRHSSPKTLKSYVGYTRQFQAFVKSKDSGLVGVEDVKAF